ncbi:hypothetical protein [Xanthomonas citri]|uniref:hypothetical protein n=1 Tax=Xanthomonas citri TaxID=346 RepID=UPI000528153E|nr:hypothetical protein [Xanthomonas citri]MBE0315277.1 hypothetical protein [Xanthomonas citri pv. punicae]MDS0760752.1 hypothetical protein [Xanthomonas citri pv. punicae]MDS0764529.1 hypothetical protein [Xanthomonas citri pv. punicae]MDS0799293.1 hypothetical protein [Xanthomonas citri pv. punicae]MDS0835777.1 hypothetical protein [Xanthomonas citri pv. punicae]
MECQLRWRDPPVFETLICSWTEWSPVALADAIDAMIRSRHFDPKAVLSRALAVAAGDAPRSIEPAIGQHQPRIRARPNL